MAKTWSNEALRLTAANDSVDSRFRCSTITIQPSAAAWVCVIKDRDGIKTRFEASGSTQTGDTHDVSGIIFEGATLATATNLTSVTFNKTEHIYNSAVSLSG